MNEWPTLAAIWARQRSAWPRLPLLVFMGFLFVGYLKNPGAWTIFDGLNLGIHELGHYVFSPFGHIMTAFGGSLLQCLVPVIALIMFHRQHDWFAMAIAVGWLATNLFGVATYVGDARVMELPLVTPGGGEASHDWNYILGNLGWIRSAESIASAIRFGAVICMLTCLLGGLWLVLRMRWSGVAMIFGRRMG